MLLFKFVYRNFCWKEVNVFLTVMWSQIYHSIGILQIILNITDVSYLTILLFKFGGHNPRWKGAMALYENHIHLQPYVISSF